MNYSPAHRLTHLASPHQPPPFNLHINVDNQQQYVDNYKKLWISVRTMRGRHVYTQQDVPTFPPPVYNGDNAPQPVPTLFAAPARRIRISLHTFHIPYYHYGFLLINMWKELNNRRTQNEATLRLIPIRYYLFSVG